jgi:hypothetical protein
MKVYPFGLMFQIAVSALPAMRRLICLHVYGGVQTTTIRSQTGLSRKFRLRVGEKIQDLPVPLPRSEEVPELSSREVRKLLEDLGITPKKLSEMFNIPEEILKEMCPPQPPLQ